MEVRRGVVEDAVAVATVHVRTWQAAYRGLLPQDLLDGLRPEQRVLRWQTTLREAGWPARGTLVAVDAGELVGFADLFPSRDHPPTAGVGEVTAFYVLPAAWGRGVGRALMGEAVATFAAAGCTSAELWVLGTNASAIAFYEALGWRLDGTARDDEHGGLTVRDLRMGRLVRPGRGGHGASPARG